MNLVKKRTSLSLFLGIILSLYSLFAHAQTGSVYEPVRYIGGNTIDPSLHEGRLRYAIGTENIQVVRANRSHPELSEDYGYTYNHAPNLAYWNNNFFLQYLSNPVGEHQHPGHTLLVASKDGRSWGKPEVIFPEYHAPVGSTLPEGSDGYMMHQRMGFYVAPNDKLLVIGFYGFTPHPFDKGGIGRVVREIRKDGSFGPIYFLRYSSFNSFDESNTSYPLYTQSDDNEFIFACEGLLKDRLKTMQWLDEDYGMDNFYGSYKVADSLEAFSYYHRPDGKVVGLWKFSATALSDDEGLTFSSPVKAKSLLMAGGKIWGQKTNDDRYALVYNPIEMQEYRFPLSVVTSDDGIIFDHLLLVQAEVPPRRFFGLWKDFGPCYTRGIVEGNGNPPGHDMWLTYSMNKEDIWISRVPLSVKYKVEEAVSDDFENVIAGGVIPDWNIYYPVWAPVKVVSEKKNQVLALTDTDPYDYARAIRVFKESEKAKISLRVKPHQNAEGKLQLEVADQFGNRPVRIYFAEDGKMVAYDGGQKVSLIDYEAGKWYNLEIDIDVKNYGNYSLKVNGKEVLHEATLCEAVKSVERLSLRTGDYRNYPTRKTPNQNRTDALEGVDERTKEAVFWIDNLKVN
ncbi:exo-alpha-sialidase [Fulvivirga ligni]|uniref:exo-alpha-sialidase n=1 Tax=Fulvivirga ligni TaxID=2904246 RepID=UPI001F3A0E68|nr:exo-alpha-sialidase [Fulvivirga ligni]UII20870.1 exo-alpha-sialidase [Fulvivirga ligni]